MNKLILNIIFLIASISMNAQVKLNVEISGLRNDNGFILLELRDGNNKFVKGYAGKISNNKSIVEISDLDKGKYSFKYFHDENKNKTLDLYWFRAPKEGYGFSNDAEGKFGPPPFEDTILDIQKDTVLKCKAHYIID